MKDGWRHTIFMCVLVISVAACTAYESGANNACGQVSEQSKDK